MYDQSTQYTFSALEQRHIVINIWQIEAGYEEQSNMKDTFLINIHSSKQIDHWIQSIKDKITTKAHKLSDLILETRRILLIRVGFNEGVRRTQGLECHPNVTCGEISGHYIDLPSTYSNLSHVPITTTADMRTGVHYTTHANKRAFPFFALEHNPYKN